MITRIVVTHYRYKRPPPKKKGGAMALAIPVVVTPEAPANARPATREKQAQK
jgi:hypothetical protein